MEEWKNEKSSGSSETGDVLNLQGSLPEQEPPSSELEHGTILKNAFTELDFGVKLHRCLAQVSLAGGISVDELCGRLPGLKSNLLSKNQYDQSSNESTTDEDLKTEFEDEQSYRFDEKLSDESFESILEEHEPSSLKHLPCPAMIRDGIKKLIHSHEDIPLNIVVDTNSKVSDYIVTNKILKFQKYWSFNHPVYATKLCIQNVSNEWVSYKVIPSNPQKLCMKEGFEENILPPGGSTEVTISTNSMIPYKFVDIKDESLIIESVPVEAQAAKPLPCAKNVDVGTFYNLEEVCHLCMEIPIQGATKRFWTKKLDPSAPRDLRLYTIEIPKLFPAEKYYLSEKSVMWSEWGPLKRIRQRFGNFNAWFPSITLISGMLFNRNIGIITGCFLLICANFVRIPNLDATENMSAAKRKIARSTRKEACVTIIAGTIGALICLYLLLKDVSKN